MSATWEDLRDLAVKLEQLAREHSAWSMAHREVMVLSDHLHAKARVQELNHAGTSVTLTVEGFGGGIGDS